MPQPECIFELPLHGLHVRVLNQEGGTKLAELSKLNLPGSVLVDLGQQVFQLLLSGSEAHRPHDLPEVVGREEFHLLGVEKVKANLEALDLVRGKSGGLIELLEVDSFKLVRHGGLLTDVVGEGCEGRLGRFCQLACYCLSAGCGAGKQEIIPKASLGEGSKILLGVKDSFV